MSCHQGENAAKKYSIDVLEHRQGFFMMDIGGADTGHALAILVASSKSQKALAMPTNPSTMSPTPRQHLVEYARSFSSEYAAQLGPIVADMRPAVHAER